MKKCTSTPYSAIPLHYTVQSRIGSNTTYRACLSRRQSLRTPHTPVSRGRLVTQKVPVGDSRFGRRSCRFIGRLPCFGRKPQIISRSGLRLDLFYLAPHQSHSLLTFALPGREPFLILKPHIRSSAPLLYYGLSVAQGRERRRYRRTRSASSTSFRPPRRLVDAAIWMARH